MGDFFQKTRKTINPLIMLSLMGSFILTGCSASMKKFELLASESAPEGFPMEVVDGHFYDKKGGSLYIPPGRTIQDGWGKGVSTHIVGADKKYLPYKFDILCFSYSENAFYAGEFDLPYDRIYQLFEKGYPLISDDEDGRFRYLIAGVAPGGYVTIWAEGIEKRVEIFSGEMEKVEAPWVRVVDNPEISREAFVDLELKESLSDEQYKAVKEKKIPFGLWEKYARRYKWKPIVSNVNYDGIVQDIKFVNGEKNYYSIKHNNDWADRDYPVPTELTFTWVDLIGRRVMAEITFDKDIIIQSFENMSQKTNAPFVLDVHIEQSEKGYYYSAGLVAGDITEPVNKINIRHY